ncbi:MAG: sodium:proton antiporter [Phycisphaera sp.]|nr:sodium:proton antiporter [Phycisphaera sp.]
MFSPGVYNYWVVIVLMMIGFYTVITRGNLVKKIIGLNVFQVSVFWLYISMGKIVGGTAPITPDDVWEHLEHDVEEVQVDGQNGEPPHAANSYAALPREGRYEPGFEYHPPADDEPAGQVTHEYNDPTVYSNPVPHVLILTAIVVGVATTSLGLALCVRIKEEYGTIEEDEIQALDDEP